MSLETFYPAAVLALGPPKILKTSSGFLTQKQYFEEFVTLADGADVFGFKDRRYPLTKDEREPLYRKLFDDFVWWWDNRG